MVHRTLYSANVSKMKKRINFNLKINLNKKKETKKNE